MTNDNLNDLSTNYRLDPWSNLRRRMPSDIVRSALFSVRNKNMKREFCQETEIACTGNATIHYTGCELRQDDALVWYQMIHLAKDKPLGEVVEFTAHDFCKSIGWDPCGKSYKRLRSCLSRMQATALQINSKEHAFGISLSLISSFMWQDELGDVLSHYRVRMPRELVALFGQYSYTQIEWSQRLRISDGVASWLHSYYASHKKPYDIYLETIRVACGSECSVPRDFKRTVEKALNELQAVGFLKTWSITNNKIHVERQKPKTILAMPMDLVRQLGRI